MKKCCSGENQNICTLKVINSYLYAIRDILCMKV